MESDSSLMETAFECLGELEIFHKSLEDMSLVAQSLPTVATTNKVIAQIQAQMQELQIKQHYSSINKGKRKVQGVPQSQTAALPRHQEEEEADKSKQAQIEQTYEKH